MVPPPRLLTSEEEKALGTLVQQWQELVQLKQQLILDQKLPQQQQQHEDAPPSLDSTVSSRGRQTSKPQHVGATYSENNSNASSSSSKISSSRSIPDGVHVFSKPQHREENPVTTGLTAAPETPAPMFLQPDVKIESPWEAVAAATGMSQWAIQVQVMLGSRAMRMLVAYNTR